MYNEARDVVIPVEYDGTLEELEKAFKDTYHKRQARENLGLTFNRFFEVRRRVPIKNHYKIGNYDFFIPDFGEGNTYYGPEVFTVDGWFESYGE